MSLKSVSFIIVTLLSASAVKAAVLEIAEENETIVASVDGTPLAVDLDSSPVDHWTIQLPAGYTFNNVGNFYNLGEPESATEYNQVAITQPTFMTWDSDLAANAGTPGPFDNPITIPGGAVFIPAAGGQTQTLDLRLVDRITTAPDVGSTLGLAGFGAATLLGLRRRIRR